MTGSIPPHSGNADTQSTREAQRTERWELLGHLQALLEPIMIGLGVVFLILLFVDYGGLLTTEPHAILLTRALLVIWCVFLVDFGLRFAVAPEKIRFLRANWLTILSLAIPFLRPVRALRAVRAIRSLNLVRLLGGVNRGMRILRSVSKGHQFAYAAGLTVLVVVAGAVGVWFFDRGASDATIVSFGDAIWWSSTLITTISNEQYPVTLESRVLALLMRVYAVSVFGFVTATIASYLVGQRFRPDLTEREQRDVGDQMAALRLEIQSIRQELRAARQSNTGV